MADTIYTRALAQAVEMHGSTQALASELRVPENTLQRWISGRAQMPLQAFHRTIELLAGHERQAGAPAPAALTEPVALAFDRLSARCGKCGGERFLAPVARDALRMTSELQCADCNARTTYAEVVGALATLAVRQARRPQRPAASRASRQMPPGARPPEPE